MAPGLAVAISGPLFFSELGAGRYAPSVADKAASVVAMMTLGDMRENGVRSLAITSGALWCHHQAVLDVSAFADDLTVPSFGPRMVCTVCGAIGADAPPELK